VATLGQNTPKEGMKLLTEHVPKRKVVFSFDNCGEYHLYVQQSATCAGCFAPIGRRGQFYRLKQPPFSKDFWTFEKTVFHDGNCFNLWKSMAMPEIDTRPRRRTIADRLHSKFRPAFLDKHEDGQAAGPNPFDFIKSLGIK
jgi:hypothetical protein